MLMIDAIVWFLAPRNVCPIMTAALLTSTSTGPKSSSTLTASSAISAHTATFTVYALATASGTLSTINRTVSSLLAWSTSTHATLAPNAANRTASSRPKPLPVPVICTISNDINRSLATRSRELRDIREKSTSTNRNSRISQRARLNARRNTSTGYNEYELKLVGNFHGYCENRFRFKHYVKQLCNLFYLSPRLSPNNFIRYKQLNFRLAYDLNLRSILRMIIESFRIINVYISERIVYHVCNTHSHTQIIVYIARNLKNFEIIIFWEKEFLILLNGIVFVRVQNEKVKQDFKSFSDAILKR